ncbi:MAG TPA: branched-chain amino acid transaminase [Anaerolineae bacterium]|nr:branched-chain amino acid transaminase [Anaerolineae bacterium]
MTSEHPTYIWMNGEFIPWEEAKLHVTTAAVQTGSRVFEGMRAYWNDSQEQLYIFKMEEHLRRLAQSMKMMRMNLDFSLEEIRQALVDVLVKNDLREDVHLSPSVYFGVGQSFFSYKPGTVDVGVYVLAQPRQSILGTGQAIHVCVSSWTRISDRDIPPRIKAAANYQNGRLATVQAAEDGYDDAILLNELGKVAEAPAACVFLVRDGTALTPPVTGGILESITRTTLIQLLEEQMSVPVVEREVDRTELYIADEVFMCGSAFEVTPIFSVDRYQVGDGKVGPLTARLQTEYENVVRGKNPKYSDWVLPVYGS